MLLQNDDVCVDGLHVVRLHVKHPDNFPLSLRTTRDGMLTSYLIGMHGVLANHLLSRNVRTRARCWLPYTSIQVSN